MQRVLGLHGLTLDDHLTDPADRILHDRSSLSASEPVWVSLRLRFLYRFLYWSRHFLPFAVMARTVAAVARCQSNRMLLGVSDIARAVHAVELQTKRADCYPRALVTCYLCLRHRRKCELSIGTLAPTRMMHAWCSTEGQLPYEARPEHYMYRPVLVLRLSP